MGADWDIIKKQQIKEFYINHTVYNASPKHSQDRPLEGQPGQEQCREGPTEARQEWTQRHQQGEGAGGQRVGEQDPETDHVEQLGHEGAASGSSDESGKYRDKSQLHSFEIQLDFEFCAERTPALQRWHRGTHLQPQCQLRRCLRQQPEACGRGKPGLAHRDELVLERLWNC